jgi:hypothetical protein
MSLRTALPPPADAAALRRFGIVAALLVALLFGGLLPWLSGRSSAAWPWLLAAVLALLAVLAPRLLNLVYRPWMLLGHYLGLVNTRVLLFLVYYAVFMPTGLVMRLAGRNPMSGVTDAVDSYRVPSRVREPTHFERPY